MRLAFRLCLDKLGIWADLCELDLSCDKCFYLQIGNNEKSPFKKLGQYILKPCQGHCNTCLP